MPDSIPFAKKIFRRIEIFSTVMYTKQQADLPPSYRTVNT